MRRFTVFFYLCVFLTPALTAQNIHRTDVIALGTGNAYLANGDDFIAFLYNPALLSRVDKSFQIELVNAYSSFSSNLFSTKSFLEDRQDDFADFRSNALSSDPALRMRSQRLQEDVTNEYLNQPADVSINPGVVISWQHFALAIFSDVRYGYVIDFAGIFDEQAQRFDAPSSRTRGEQDVAVSLGYGNRIVGGLSFGATLKFFRRRIAQRRLTPTDYDEILRIARQAIGDAEFSSRFGVDFGLAYTFEDRVTVAAVLYDINNSDNLLDLEPLDVRVGLTWRILRTLDLNVDIYDLLNKTDDPRAEEAIYFGPLEQVRAGLQFSGLQTSAVQFPLRVGFDGDFMTAGASVVFPNISKFAFRLDYALTNDSRVNEREHFFQAKLKLTL